MAVLFELWKSWSAEVYGGRSRRTKEAVLYAVWERWVVSGQTLEARKPSRFKEKAWQQIGLLGNTKGSWRVSCPWVRPHHGSE